jgi:hypothetical protein
VIELLGSFRDIMRRNFETLDVDKIQDRWFVLPLDKQASSKTHLANIRIGVAATNLGYSANDGKSFSKISVTSSRRSLIPLG